MKDDLYNILASLNEILKDIDALVDTVQICFEENMAEHDSEKARSVLRVHWRVLEGIRDDGNKLYNQIDQIILDMGK